MFDKNKNNESYKDPITFGIRPVIEAINSGKEIDKILIQNGLKGELIRDLMPLIKENKINFQFVPVQKLNSLTRGNHQGVVAYISEIPFQNIEYILPGTFEQGKMPLILILDRITDVRNFGAIARTAECSGVDAIIIPFKGAAQVNGIAVKTSAGALMRIPVCKSHNLKNTIEFLKESGLQIISCTEKTDNLIYNADLNKPTALIMGSEEDGISEEYMKRSDMLVKIPVIGAIESLNVSVACGVILYEAVRQRTNL
ncbi:MAG: 23S rRNA (guanosine(2251)-2'-O)-methyltransferase RlmB [Bacteroidota bacterium]|nr:23S rRNA (guanosine(2251)-2'-O)-methyltransferase RlmB [Bacteroidota bacterium]